MADPFAEFEFAGAATAVAESDDPFAEFEFAPQPADEQEVDPFAGMTFAPDGAACATPSACGALAARSG